MRNLKHTIFLLTLLSQFFCFGQKTYKFTDGKLQFINPEYGIVIKKDKKLYIWTTVLRKANDSITPELIEIPSKLIGVFKKNRKNTYPKDIKPYDFENLKKIRFTVKKKEKNDVRSCDLFQFNNEYFVKLFTHNESISAEVSKYQIVDFGGNSIVLVLNDQLIIPIKKDFIINAVPAYPDKWLGIFVKAKNEFEKYSIEENKTNDSEKKAVSEALDLHFFIYYKIDTLKNNKVILKNYFGEPVINKEYDSITGNNPKINETRFILGYNRSGIDLYTSALQKIDIKNFRAVKFYCKCPDLSHYDCSYHANVLDGNQVKIFDELGNIQDDSFKLVNEFEKDKQIIKPTAKYKSLGEFNGYFARFELPNGQKGWLTLDGKEYMDN